MEMRNHTPFPNIRFYNSDGQRREFGVAVLKATFEFRNDRLAVAAEQAPILLEDTYHGLPNVSSLLWPSDIVAAKPRTDLVLNAIARTKGGKSLASWTCGVKVVGGAHAFDRRIKVSGPRAWRPTWHVPQIALALLNDKQRHRFFKRWVLEDPAPTHEIQIRYELAFGGTIAIRQRDSADPLSQAHDYNPIGCGWVSRENVPGEGCVAAPQIVWTDCEQRQPTDEAKIAGLGPIPPSWLPRLPLGGTYDEAWQKDVWPHWPSDYDFAYNNSANPELIYPAFLSGHETIVLDGFFEDRDFKRVPLPSFSMMLCTETALGKTSQRMDLDTVAIDIADRDHDEHRVFLTWRAMFDRSATFIEFSETSGDFVSQRKRDATIA